MRLTQHTPTLLEWSNFFHLFGVNGMLYTSMTKRVGSPGAMKSISWEAVIQKGQFILWWMIEYDLSVQCYGWVSPVSDGWVVTGCINRQHWIKRSYFFCKQRWWYVSGTKCVPSSAVYTSKRWWKNDEGLETITDMTTKGVFIMRQQLKWKLEESSAMVCRSLYGQDILIKHLRQRQKWPRDSKFTYCETDKLTLKIKFRHLWWAERAAGKKPTSANAVYSSLPEVSK